MPKHEIRCVDCDHRWSVDYEMAKSAERGELTHDSPESLCRGRLVRVWGATGHIWGQSTGRETGIDLG